MPPPIIINDLFGTSYCFTVVGLHIMLSRLLASGAWETRFLCFHQNIPDAPIDATLDASGLLGVTYLNSSGNRLAQYSSLDGDSGSWA